MSAVSSDPAVPSYIHASWEQQMPSIATGWLEMKVIVCH